MIQRSISKEIEKMAKKMPVIGILGPRQSGKTTLVRSLFASYPYASLEDLETREYAQVDPKGFLAQYQKGVILDEVQRVPSLFSYIQTIVDEQKRSGQFILTGSHNYLLHEHISQTLAGRIALFTLLPLSIQELQSARFLKPTLEEALFFGCYPRIYDQQLDPKKWYADYIQTYVERDVRLIKQITDVHQFQHFIRLCAGRIGQQLNLSALGNECGVTHNTAKSWISVLESSYILFLLQPHFANFNKRIVKMPKLYFYDTGLATSLLGIENEHQMRSHYLFGGLFESFMLSEYVKFKLNVGQQRNCYYWRDHIGHEIDCIIEEGQRLVPIEMKSGKTIGDSFFANIQYWKKIAGNHTDAAYVVYGGDVIQRRTDVTIVGWKQFIDIIGSR